MFNLKSYTLLVGFFLLLITTLHADNVEYSYVPKKVYEKQVFPISFLTTNREKDDDISFTFEGSKQPILEKPVIIRNGAKTFHTFYFKTTQKVFQIPEVHINFNGTEEVLAGVNIPVQKLLNRENFSGVIASGLKIKSYQSSIYDERTNLIAIAIEAYDANLEDIYMPQAMKDGVENEQREGSRMEINYYIVLPSTQKDLTFSYFDTIKETFVEQTIPIIIQDGEVAAQTDLNPKDDSFEALKKYALITLTALFLLLFLWKKDFFYLIMGVVASGVLLTFYTPISTVCVKEGSPLYIVPTANSTTSIHIDQRFTTTKLGERNDFIKIEYKNGMVGWIKHEDICDN